MATYEELRGLFGQDSLRNRVEVALIIKVHAILEEDAPSADRLAWAKSVLGNSRSEAESLMKYVLAANSDTTIQQINGASDADIASAVSSAVNKLYQ